MFMDLLRQRRKKGINFVKITDNNKTKSKQKTT